MKLRLILSIAISLGFAGCEVQNPQAVPLPEAPTVDRLEPFAVTTNDGITHEFYRDLSFQKFLQQLPPHSVDVIDLQSGGSAGNLNLQAEDSVIALVRVPDDLEGDSEFVTVFEIRDGEAIEKRWKAANRKKTGATAVFSLPMSAVGGTTKAALPN